MCDFKYNRNHSRVEVVDGVTIVHTNEYQSVNCFDGKIREIEVLEIYDNNGNRFYSNFDSVEKANEAIERLAKEGITAVIGPKGPWTDFFYFI